MEDKRFAHVVQDPKFRRIPKGERKVKIDKRFQSMFKDKRFKVKYTTDKRGRPVNHTSTEDLKRYYELSSESSSESESEEDEKKDASGTEETKDINKLNVPHKSDKSLPDNIKSKLKNLKVDYARGECLLFSESSSDDEESDDEVEDIDEVDHKWGELDADAETTEEATYRLAICNLDWDRIRAVDIMVLLNSFLPPSGSLKSVIIYPSEFGKQRMAEEEVKGPIELVESKPRGDDENEEGSKYHMEKLRQYQLNRLKYYYAVATFDSVNSANKIYTECDGMEYESSATKLDLRFIPDDMSFDDSPKEVCDKLPDMSKYQPRFFTTTALQQAKVDLTWDETNPDRIEISEKLNTGKIDDISEVDLQNYLAPSSDEESATEQEENEESDNDNPIEKYKALLQDIEDKEHAKKNQDVEMEITWGIDLKQKTDKLIKEKQAEKEELTPFQQYLEKRKEKRKEKREKKKNDKQNGSESDNSDVPSDIDMNDPYFAEEFNNSEFKKPSKKRKNKEMASDEEQNNAELELLLMNEEDDKKHFSLKKIQENETASSKKSKKKQKVEKSDDFAVNVNDDRFSAIFTSHHYNIDPSDPHYKKTKGMETLINEKLKRKNIDEDSVKEVKAIPGPKKDAELSVLVKSIKRKTQSLKNKNK